MTPEQQAEVFTNVLRGLNFVVDARLNAAETPEERFEIYEICVKALTFNALETLYNMTVPRLDAIQMVNETYDKLADMHKKDMN